MRYLPPLALLLATSAFAADPVLKAKLDAFEAELRTAQATSAYNVEAAFAWDARLEALEREVASFPDLSSGAITLRGLIPPRGLRVPIYRRDISKTVRWRQFAEVGAAVSEPGTPFSNAHHAAFDDNGDIVAVADRRPLSAETILAFWRELHPEAARPPPEENAQGSEAAARVDSLQREIDGLSETLKNGGAAPDAQALARLFERTTRRGAGDSQQADSYDALREQLLALREEFALDTSETDSDPTASQSTTQPSTARRRRRRRAPQPTPVVELAEEAALAALEGLPIPDGAKTEVRRSIFSARERRSTENRALQADRLLDASAWSRALLYSDTLRRARALPDPVERDAAVRSWLADFDAQLPSIFPGEEELRVRLATALQTGDQSKLDEARTELGQYYAGHPALAQYRGRQVTHFGLRADALATGAVPIERAFTGAELGRRDERTFRNGFHQGIEGIVAESPDGSLLFQSKDGLTIVQVAGSSSPVTMAAGIRRMDAQGRILSQVAISSTSSQEIIFQFDDAGRNIGRTIIRRGSPPDARISRTAPGFTRNHAADPILSTEQITYDPETGLPTAVLESAPDGRPVRRTTFGADGMVHVLDSATRVMTSGKYGDDGQFKPETSTLEGTTHRPLVNPNSGALAGIEIDYNPTSGEPRFDALVAAGHMTAEQSAILHQQWPASFLKLTRDAPAQYRPIWRVAPRLIKTEHGWQLYYKLYMPNEDRVREVTWGYDPATNWVRSQHDINRAGEDTRIEIYRAWNGMNGQFAAVDVHSTVNTSRYNAGLLNTPLKGWEVVQEGKLERMTWDQSRRVWTAAPGGSTPAANDGMIDIITKNISFTFANAPVYSHVGTATGYVAEVGKLAGYTLTGGAAEAIGRATRAISSEEGAGENHIVYGVISQYQAIQWSASAADTMMDELKEKLGEKRFEELRTGVWPEQYRAKLLEDRSLLPADRVAIESRRNFSEAEIAQFLISGQAGLGFAGSAGEFSRRAAQAQGAGATLGWGLLSAGTHAADFTFQSLGFVGIASGVKAFGTLGRGAAGVEGATAVAATETAAAGATVNATGQASLGLRVLRAGGTGVLRTTQYGAQAAQGLQNAYFQSILLQQGLEGAVAYSKGDADKLADSICMMAAIGLMPHGKERKGQDRTAAPKTRAQNAATRWLGWAGYNANVGPRASPRLLVDMFTTSSLVNLARKGADIARGGPRNPEARAIAEIDSRARKAAATTPAQRFATRWLGWLGYDARAPTGLFDPRAATEAALRAADQPPPPQTVRPVEPLPLPDAAAATPAGRPKLTIDGLLLPKMPHRDNVLAGRYEGRDVVVKLNATEAEFGAQRQAADLLRSMRERAQAGEGLPDNVAAPEPLAQAGAAAFQTRAGERLRKLVDPEHLEAFRDSNSRVVVSERIGKDYVSLKDILAGREMAEGLSTADMAELRRAVEFLNENGSAHGDLTNPGNILVGRQRVGGKAQFRLIDWDGRPAEPGADLRAIDALTANLVQNGRLAADAPPQTPRQGEGAPVVLEGRFNDPRAPAAGRLAGELQRALAEPSVPHRAVALGESARGYLDLLTELGGDYVSALAEVRERIHNENPALPERAIRQQAVAEVSGTELGRLVDNARLNLDLAVKARLQPAPGEVLLFHGVSDLTAVGASEGLRVSSPGRSHFGGRALYTSSFFEFAAEYSTGKGINGEAPGNHPAVVVTRVPANRIVEVDSTLATREAMRRVESRGQAGNRAAFAAELSRVIMEMSNDAVAVRLKNSQGDVARGYDEIIIRDPALLRESRYYHPETLAPMAEPVRVDARSFESVPHRPGAQPVADRAARTRFIADNFPPDLAGVLTLLHSRGATVSQKIDALGRGEAPAVLTPAEVRSIQRPGGRTHMRTYELTRTGDTVEIVVTEVPIKGQGKETSRIRIPAAESPLPLTPGEIVRHVLALDKGTTAGPATTARRGESISPIPDALLTTVAVGSLGRGVMEMSRADIRSAFQDNPAAADLLRGNDSVAVKTNGKVGEAARQRAASRVPAPDNIIIPRVAAEGPLPQEANLRIIVMEKAGGTGLDQYLASRASARLERPISSTDWSAFERHIRALNDRGIAHGDISNPENIRISMDASGKTTFWLIDFGEGGIGDRARLAKDSTDLTSLREQLSRKGLLETTVGEPLR